MKNLIAVCIALVTAASTLTLVAQGENTDQAAEEELNVRDSNRGILAKTEGSQFSIDPNLVDKLYDSAVKGGAVVTAESEGTRGQLELAFGFMIPQTMTLQNKYFEVPYNENVGALPYGAIQFTKAITHVGSTTINGFGLVGYSYVQDIYDVRAKTGLRLKDSVTLQWIPVQAGSSIEFLRVAPGFLKPAFYLAAGADWIAQTGTLDGMTQNYLIPHVTAGPAVTLFPNTNKHQVGFDGITLSSLYRASYGSEQTLRGWSFNVGSRFAM